MEQNDIKNDLLRDVDNADSLDDLLRLIDDAYSTLEGDHFSPEEIETFFEGFFDEFSEREQFRIRKSQNNVATLKNTLSAYEILRKMRSQSQQ